MGKKTPKNKKTTCVREKNTPKQITLQIVRNHFFGGGI